MLIDWFTVVAQAVNFLILVGLLKRFLYRPVLAAIDAREKKIAAQLAAATQRETQARTEREEFHNRNEALAHEREEILRKASDAADAERHRLLESARQDAQMLRARLSKVLATEREELGRQLAARTQAEVLSLTRKVLDELAGVDIEARMIEVFIAHLHALPESELKSMSGAATGSGDTRASRVAIVRTAFELEVPQRAAIEHAVMACLGPELPVRFELGPGLVCGIELTLEGVKLAWCVTDYLADLEKAVLELTTEISAPTMETPMPTAAEAALALATASAGKASEPETETSVTHPSLQAGHA